MRITRRQALKGALAASVAALIAVDICTVAKAAEEPWMTCLGYDVAAKRPIIHFRDTDTLHLNSLHYPKPTVWHHTVDYGNGNLWYVVHGQDQMEKRS